MNVPTVRQHIQSILAACTVLATSIVLVPADQQAMAENVSAPASQQADQKQALQAPARYPSLVYTVPRCYTWDSAAKVCGDLSSDLVLNFKYLEPSDSVLWQDLKDLMGKYKFWRLMVFKSADGTLRYNSDWKSSQEKTVRAGLPLEVLLAADFEFCNEDTSLECDTVSEPKIEGRHIPFLMHRFPEAPRMAEKVAAGQENQPAAAKKKMKKK